MTKDIRPLSHHAHHRCTNRGGGRVCLYQRHGCLCLTRLHPNGIRCDLEERVIILTKPGVNTL